MCWSFLPTRLTPVKMVKGYKLKCDHFGLICCSGKEKAMLGGNSYYRFGYFLSESERCSVMSNSSIPWNSSGQNTGVGSLCLLQGIFPTQGLNPGLAHSRQILYHLSHQWSPRILECVACPFSSVSSWPRNRTRVSCIAGGFFTSWATRDPPGRKFGDFLRISQSMCSLGLLSYGWSRAHRLLRHFFAACTCLSCYTCLDVWGSAFSILAQRSAPHFQPFWR